MNFFIKKLSSSMLYSNIFIILYTSILSFFCFSGIFGIKRLWFHFLWIIYRDNLIIMYIPVLFFITQILFTLRNKRTATTRKIILQTLNLIFIYIISYFIFYIIFSSFFYNGEQL